MGVLRHLEALAGCEGHAWAVPLPRRRPLAAFLEAEAVEKAEEARAVTSLAAAELRKVLQESNQASEDALAAAQVAVVTEAVAFIGRPAFWVVFPWVAPRRLAQERLESGSRALFLPGGWRPSVRFA